jgi:hypothetical protein
MVQAARDLLAVDTTSSLQIGSENAAKPSAACPEDRHFRSLDLTFIICSKRVGALGVFKVTAVEATSHAPGYIACAPQA